MARDRFKVRVDLEAQDNASANIGKVQGSFARLGSFLASRFVFTLGDVQRAFTATFQAIREAATLEQQERTLKAQLGNIGKDFDSFIQKLEQVSDGTISTAAAIEGSSKALLLGIPADDISKLLEVARVSAAATGQSVSDAFNDIATGIGRASPLILDNLGFVVKLGDANQALADDLGKTTEQLSAAERKQALLNEVLRQGAERAEQFGGEVGGLSTTLQQNSAAFENLQDAAKGATAAVVEGAASSGDGARAANELADAIERNSSVFSFLGSVIGATLDDRTKTIRQFLDISGAVSGLGQSFKVLFDFLQPASTAVKETADALEDAGETAEETAERLKKAAEAAEEMANAYEHAVDATTALGVATSVQLEAKILKIILELSDQKKILGENSDEFVRLRQTGEEQIAALQLRIESLRSGMGDLKNETTGARDSFDALGESTVIAGERLDEYNERIQRTRSELQELESQQRRTNDEIGGGAGTPESRELAEGLRPGTVSTFVLPNGVRAPTTTPGIGRI